MKDRVLVHHEEQGVWLLLGKVLVVMDITEGITIVVRFID